jgi:hypothetical protein
MPKGYWEAFRQFLKGIGKPLGNAQIHAVSQLKRRHYCPAAISKNVTISIPFSEEMHFGLHLLEVEGAVENFKNAQRFFSYFCSFQPYHF